MQNHTKQVLFSSNLLESLLFFYPSPLVRILIIWAPNTHTKWCVKYSDTCRNSLHLGPFLRLPTLPLYTAPITHLFNFIIPDTKPLFHHCFITHNIILFSPFTLHFLINHHFITIKILIIPYTYNALFFNSKRHNTII